jgi:HD-GYP domain-containing protein (c-di-GMP phosphodiesterase class II)
MATTEQTHHMSVSVKLNKLREHLGRAADASRKTLPWTEEQHEALLRVVPDQVFRVRLQQDGSVLITGDGIHVEVPVDALADSGDRTADKDRPEGLTGMLCEELARLTKDQLNGFPVTEEVRTLRTRSEHEDRTVYHEIRATMCAPGEAVALIRDATAGQEAEDGMSKSSGAAPSMDSMLRRQVSQYAEDEEVIRDVSVKLNSLLEDTIRAIQSVVQKKDPSTARHQARVWKLSCAIGEEMGLGKTRVAVIGLAALVHDFGKVFISPDILNKPGKLTDAEFSEVKNHAESVFQILSTIDVFCPIADIVHQHHERMNGSGYPLGLKGDEILLEARIIAVADVVEAMLSDRPHRRALGVEVAMREIADGRGILYDADAVDTCISLFTVRKFEFDAETDLPARTAPSKS